MLLAQSIDWATGTVDIELLAQPTVLTTTSVDFSATKTASPPILLTCTSVRVQKQQILLLFIKLY